MSTEILMLIHQYEEEMEPDITLMTEFKRGVRIAPIIEQYHSVFDFKKWLDKKLSLGVTCDFCGVLVIERKNLFINGMPTLNTCLSEKCLKKFNEIEKNVEMEIEE